MYPIIILIASVIMSLTIVGFVYPIYILWATNMIDALGKEDLGDFICIIIVTILLIIMCSAVVFFEYLIVTMPGL